MKPTLKILTFVVFVLSGSTLAFAKNDSGLFVEPGISFQFSDAKVDWPAPFSNSTGSANGLGLLAKFGFHLNEVFFVAVDGRYQRLTIKDSNNNYEADANGFNIAPTVGIQMPNIGLRVWGAYVLAGQLDPEASSNLDLKFTEANGFRLGAGFRIASLSLNLEYEDLNYGKTELEQMGPFASTSDSDSVKLNSKTYILSVSFPLEI